MIPPAVLAAYPPAVRDCRWEPLPPGGGLNGGQVWRGELGGEPLFALKRWPASHTPDRMQLVHERMRAVADLGLTPLVMPTHAGTSVVVHGRCCWDVTSWMPGTPELLTPPSPPQLRAAGTALARLHGRWLDTTTEHAPCGAIARQLKLFAEWERSRFRFDGPPDQVAELERSVQAVSRHLPVTRAELRHVERVRGRVVAIHGDFWPENVLFQHERLTAVLDFGNVGLDHPEVDLGRLFADVPGADRSLIATAVEAYNAVAPFDLSVSLVELLAASGRLCSLANWHLRLNAGSPDAHLLPAALPRIRRLIALISDADRLG